MRSRVGGRCPIFTPSRSLPYTEVRRVAACLVVSMSKKLWYILCLFRSQLRSSAGVLESIIWCFRTRVAPFELDITNPDSRRPEARSITFYERPLHT